MPKKQTRVQKWEKDRRANMAKAAAARAQPNRMRGQGSYSDFAKWMDKHIVPKGTFEGAGRAVGGHLGGVAGEAVGGGGGKAVGRGLGSKAGGSAGKAIAKLLGFGDYHVKQNSLSRAGGRIDEGAPLPSFGDKNHCTPLVHREYIGELLAPASPLLFHVTSYKLNPANASVLPWGSTVAQRYQQWICKGMVFEFQSNFSDITAGGALGTVVMATNYNTNDSNFSSKAQMENSEYAVSKKPSISQMHAIECDRSFSPTAMLYVDTGVAPGSVEDERLYNLGNFQIATQGLPCAEGTSLGELWVTYDIELYKPFLPTTDAAANDATALLWIPTDVAEFTPWGDTPITDNPAFGREEGVFQLGNVFQREGVLYPWHMGLRAGSPAMVKFMVHATIPQAALEEPPVLDLLLFSYSAGVNPKYMDDDSCVVWLDSETYHYVVYCTVLLQRPFAPRRSDDPYVSQPGISDLGLVLPEQVELNGGAYSLTAAFCAAADPRCYSYFSDNVPVPPAGADLIFQEPDAAEKAARRSKVRDPALRPGLVSEARRQAAAARALAKGAATPVAKTALTKAGFFPVPRA